MTMAYYSKSRDWEIDVCFTPLIDGINTSSYFDFVTVPNYYHCHSFTSGFSANAQVHEELVARNNYTYLIEIYISDGPRFLSPILNSYNQLWEVLRKYKIL